MEKIRARATPIPAFPHLQKPKMGEGVREFYRMIAKIEISVSGIAVFLFKRVKKIYKLVRFNH